MAHDWNNVPRHPSTESSRAETPKPKLTSSAWEKVLSFKKKAAEYTAKYPNLTTNFSTISQSLVDFHRHKTYWSLAKGAFSLVSDMQGDHLANISSFCDARDGWRYLASTSKNNIGFLFRDVIVKYPMTTIRFRDHTTAEHCELPIGSVISHKMSNQWYVYFNSNQLSYKVLTEFLVNEKFKELDSKFLFISSTEDYGTLSISPAMPATKHSELADKLTSVIDAFIKDGKNRSMFFHGPPGTGKTTLAYTILNKLDYRTIVFSANNKLCTFDLIRDIIDLMKIEAVIIDDFDQFSESNKSLDMLELFNKRLKVLIGIANSLKDFHPAILRPGRFDERILVDQLDKTCIEEVLGELSTRYYERVKHFPIAYVSELAKKSKFLTPAETDEYVSLLNEHVQDQLDSLRK